MFGKSVAAGIRYERARQQLPVRIVGEIFHKGAAEALDRRADHLAVEGQRVDDAPDILDDEIIDEIDPAGPRIDRDMRRRCAVDIGVLVVVLKARFGFQPAGRQLGECYRPAIARGGSSLGQIDFRGRATETGSRCGADLVEQSRGALEYRRTAEHGRARVE